MNKFKNYKYLLLILLTLGIITRLFSISYPNEVVFDESYFGKYSSGYLSGNYYFDLHPPLGKLLIAGMGYTAGNREDKTDYSKIGNQYNSNIYIWYRLLPIIAGILLPLIVFLLALQLRISRSGAFVVALLIIFENSLIVLSHFVSLDNFIYLFGFTSLWLYLLYRNSEKNKKIYLVSAMILAVFTYSIKWTGLSFAGLIFLIELYDLYKNRNNELLMRVLSLIKKSIIFFIIGLILYFSFFVIHFALLTKSGQGNDFMTPSFQKTLSGNQYSNDDKLEKLNLFEKFIELNVEMYAVNFNMDKTHQYSSKWYTWPLMLRPIFYWQGEVNIIDKKITRPYIYLIGNPIIYWFSTISMVILLIYLFLSFLIHIGIRKLSFLNVYSGNQFPFIFIAFGFLINFLPFIFIGRVMFLYHYSSALIFSIIALVLMIDSFFFKPRKNILLFTILFISICVFVYFLPLTYGIPISDNMLNNIIWFNNWR